MAQQHVWFVAEVCPCAEECSEQSWKRARCADDDEANCRAKVVKHLMQRGMHKRDRAEADMLAERASITVKEYDSDEYEQWMDQNKKHKKAALGSQSAALTKEETQDIVF